MLTSSLRKRKNFQFNPIYPKQCGQTNGNGSGTRYERDKTRSRESTQLEPSGSAKARKMKNELAEKRGGRCEERRKYLERAESLSRE
jgi:hypothetical protein